MAKPKPKCGLEHCKDMNCTEPVVYRDGDEIGIQYDGHTVLFPVHEAKGVSKMMLILAAD